MSVQQGKPSGRWLQPVVLRVRNVFGLDYMKGVRVPRFVALVRPREVNDLTVDYYASSFPYGHRPEVTGWITGCRSVVDQQL